MSFAYVSSPGVPTMRPRNLSGVGTVLDAGRWSTSSVVMRGSWRYSLIFLVYSSSFGCDAGFAAPAFCARTVDCGASAQSAAAAIGHANRRTGRIRSDIPYLLNDCLNRARQNPERADCILGGSTHERAKTRKDDRSISPGMRI